MKLLFLTQKVDEKDDVLGFTQKWLEKFAQKFEKITAVCLQKGEHNLPRNVKVLSLGKESGASRFKYLLNFYRYIWQERNNYDCVFVHMNQEYMLLGGLFWRLLGKKTAFWYNHHHGNLLTLFSAAISNVIFHTSPYAYSARFKNARIMPAGIATEVFRKDENISKIPYSILYLGRISPIKNLDLLIEAAKWLDKNNINFILNIVGESPQRDMDYFKKIKNLSADLEKKNKIKFWGKIPNNQTPRIYNQNEILINLSPAGLFDKTILEAMACQTAVLVSSKAFEHILPAHFIFQEGKAEDLAQKIMHIFELMPEQKKELGEKFREYVVGRQSLDSLAEKIFNAF